MPHPNAQASRLWTIASDALDIPRTLYERAAARHRAVGEWLCRPGSTVAAYRPAVRPQGSFRFGTVTRPINPDAEYDLDHVVVFEALDSTALSQQELKELLGAELRDYARAHGMRPPTEHHRCWRLHYRDEVAFHLDSLPCVPAAAGVQEALRRSGVEDSFALRAVAITDRRRSDYAAPLSQWLTSNPRGFARWFESRAALGRDPRLLEQVRAGAVEDVPPYEWRTPLQRSIQLLKRHRDVMYAADAELAPISMIITNLATHAYGGEADVADALRGIVTRMGQFVLPERPRVPNPTHPQEDYADKWAREPRLDQNFWVWYAQLQGDVEWLSAPLTRIDPRDLQERFGVTLTAEQAARLAPRAPAVVGTRDVAGAVGGAASAPLQMHNAPKPWGA